MVVEIVGPPGVGKTTLLQEVMRLKVIKRERFPVIGINLLVKKMLVEQPHCSALMDEYIVGRATQKTDLDRLQKMLNLLFSDIYLHSMLPKKQKLFLVDEGICHHFTSQLINLYHTEKNDFLKLMKKRSVVFLLADAHTIANRALKRKKSRKYREKGATELTAITQKVLHKQNELYHVMKTLGVNVVQINLNNKLRASADQLTSFLYQNKK